MLGSAQIKLVSHKYFSGIMDKNNTVKTMEVSEARSALKQMGYELIREEKEDGATIEIWELPQARQG